jgi:RHS repeat-associated protein
MFFDIKTLCLFAFIKVNRLDGDGSERQTYYYVNDHLGSTLMVTDKEGQVVWRGEVSPFGEQLGSVGILEFSAKFTGKDLDEETGLYYFNARWYDAELGRFISQDPIKDGVNWYVYCGNNPLLFVDPLGLDAYIPEMGGYQAPPEDTGYRPQSNEGKQGKGNGAAVTGSETKVNPKDSREAFDNWMNAWSKEQTAAADKLHGIKNRIWKEDPVKAAEMEKTGTLPAEYYEALENYNSVSTMTSVAEQVLNWVENQGSNGKIPTFEEINARAVGEIKAKGINETFIAPICFGFIAWAMMQPSESVKYIEKPAKVTVRTYTNAIGREGITKTGKLRTDTWVTLPKEIPNRAGHLQIEKILEIKPGRGSYYIDVDVPYSNLRIPANGPTTSGGAVQFQLNKPVPVDPSNFQLPPGRPGG